ncbi:hypothetical protein OA93_06425 [Flavobacterium sp. KMS]|uniref:hypothetical protein n=1 Tax=Flavobacterium sp. KMS TaxID=1566023 RepID=UPI00057F28CE|nr:hypothetical protein [Flavobacterium sp. KMS]KIA99260.1 hypothetical protein OA93_06425 [Flavobacterium sp. KMS]
MSTEVYSFISDKKTKEKHIFIGEPTTDSCTAQPDSICKKTKKNEGTWKNEEMCLNENDAREKAATIGRRICGTCVSNLYANY